MQLTIRFFASVREALGQGELAVTSQANSVGTLREELAARGEAWQVLASEQTLAAVNQELCDNDASLQAGDEVAFFPFMTGG